MIKLQLERAEQHASMTKRESAGDHEGPLMSSAEALVAGVQTADKKRQGRFIPDVNTVTRIIGAMNVRRMTR